MMKTILRALIILGGAVGVLAQGTLPAAKTATVSVDPVTGVVVAPAQFWLANSNGVASVLPPGNGGGSSVSVNGATVANPNLIDAATALVRASGASVTVYPTNLANAQLSPTALIALTKLAQIADQTILGNNSGGSATPSALTTLPNGVQDNITRLGTVTSGSLDAARIASGTLPIARGGTGGGTAAAALDSLITAEASVTSGTTTDLGAQSTRNVNITGTTTITSFGTATAGVMRWGRFAGALTLTHNVTSLILPGGANITTAAGDRFAAVSLGAGNWLVYVYQKADGTALVGAAGGGDFSSNTSTSVDGEVVLFSGTGGKTGKRATQTGIAKLTNGVLGTGTSGTDYAPATSGSAILKGNGAGGFSNAASGTDYAPATSGSAVLKGNGSGGFSNAAQGTDYYAPAGTDVALADGGTGASTAIGALDNLITAEASVTSATTTDLGAQTTRNVNITGTTTITSFGTATAGVMRWGRFAGALTLTHNATSLILPSAANITTAANDRFEAVSLGAGNWLVYFYQKADGTPIVSTGGSTHIVGEGTLDGGTFPLTAGLYFDRIPAATKTVSKVQILGDVSGSVTVDIIHCTRAQYDGGYPNGGTHPVLGDSITTGGSAPAISSSTSVTVSSFAGWASTTFTAGDVYRFVITGNPTGIKKVTVVVD